MTTTNTPREDTQFPFGKDPAITFVTTYEFVNLPPLPNTPARRSASDDDSTETQINLSNMLPSEGNDVSGDTVGKLQAEPVQPDGDLSVDTSLKDLPELHHRANYDSDAYTVSTVD